MNLELEILRKYFGYGTFRKGQKELIEAQLAGRDAFGIMPTGGGKSLCYQIPALIMDGVTLVVSPLISLMKDQVMALKDNGVAAAYINSSLSFEQITLVYRNMRYGKYKIIYIAPERLLTDGFLMAVSHVRISMLVVDEAHCISQWGQDFRPGYLRIVEFLKMLPYRPVVSAFTATATKGVQEDVVRLLELQEPYTVVTGFDRANLHFEVMKPKKKPETLCTLLNDRKEKCGIVYCSTRKDVEKICDLLAEKGYSATRYHAGLSDEERRNNQDDFVYDRCRIMVATNAFGMGINKSNVSFVIHYNMPQSIEAYYQEAGRAGRDGSPADCILLYSAGDIHTAKFLIKNSNDNELLSPEEQQNIRELDLKRLEMMISYCKSPTCLRGYILDYFGETHEETCNNCGNCGGLFVEKDITLQARMILSCTQRVYRKLGFYIGATLLIRTLLGSKDQRIKMLKLQELPTYGLLVGTPKAELRAMVETLESLGYLKTDPEHGGIFPTEKAKKVLFEEESVSMRVRDTVAADKKEPVVSRTDGELLAMLKGLRLRLAREANVPVYIIFSNATLEDMARKLPRTMDSFLNINGVGQYKADRYGKIFLSEINKWLSMKA